MPAKDRLEQLELDMARVSRQIAGQTVRIGDVGGGDRHHAIIRGQAVGSVSDSDVTFSIDNIVPLSGSIDPSGGNPSTTVVVTNIHAAEFGDNDYVIAAYSPGVSSSPASDWEALPTGAGSGPPLYRFELTSTKTRSSATATAKLLSHDGDLVGDAVTLHDPDERFSGQIDSYISGEAGFRGYAILATDLDEVSPGAPRFEIIDMEGMAEWVVVEWDNGGEQWNLLDAADNFGGDEWNNRRPVANGSEITIVDPADIIPTGLTSGKLFARRNDPDASPPEYVAVSMLGSGGSTIRWGRVTTSITAATDELTANWGTGAVKFADPASGVLDGSATTVDNPIIDENFVEDAQVWCDTSVDPPQVTQGTCAAVSWSS